MVSAPLAVADAGPGDKERLRLWIRMLRTTRIVEAELRERLKREFDSTLPRFDVMSALYREREGMLMSDLSRFLLVSNGNVTGIIDRLVADGYVTRTKREGDKRTSVVRLTPAGMGAFKKMAAAHESWIAELLGGVDTFEVHRLSEMLHAFRSNWEGEH
ncbi:MarR family winged helix-turn-helix transcriptional regulator [Chelativorans salis]|uniref:MarR family transcriptional regulator n=1 Tax=Chelativorans salis TaxID=2978478 RepID=A0ABT2LRR0_9HYPH|nr:MarR family transcriptional regulator [Chelativorans sp. EGI FJ00035]MCT7377225.1 MarR family transcriptional regulator [Chelativorans sp. EGI FJ00035]